MRNRKNERLWDRWHKRMRMFPIKNVIDEFNVDQDMRKSISNLHQNLDLMRKKVYRHRRWKYIHCYSNRIMEKNRDVREILERIKKMKV